MSLVVLIGLAGVVGYLGPWWGMAAAAFLVGAWRAESGWRAFVLGALGIGFWWWLVPLYTHLVSGGILTARLALLVKMPVPSLLLFVTALMGALLGGLAALAGYQGRVLGRGRWPVGR
jgi:hypothetical protein